MKKLQLLFACTILFIAHSCASLQSAAPQHGPDVTVWISHVNEQYLVSKNREEVLHMPWTATDNWVCLEPDDFDKLLEKLLNH